MTSRGCNEENGPVEFKLNESGRWTVSVINHAATIVGQLLTTDVTIDGP